MMACYFDLDSISFLQNGREDMLCKCLERRASASERPKTAAT